MEEKCVLCILMDAREDVVFETEHFFAHLDKNPVTPGHTILFPKRHAVSLFDLSNDEWMDLEIALLGTVKCIAQLEKADIYAKWIEEKPHDVSLPFWQQILAHPDINRVPDGYNIGLNEGEAAGRTIPHLHIHIIPRYLDVNKKPARGLQSGIKKVINYVNLLDNEK